MLTSPLYATWEGAIDADGTIHLRNVAVKDRSGVTLQSGGMDFEAGTAPSVILRWIFSLVTVAMDQAMTPADIISMGAAGISEPLTGPLCFGN
jgi:hypothetical protein